MLDYKEAKVDLDEKEQLLVIARRKRDGELFNRLCEARDHGRVCNEKVNSNHMQTEE